MRYCALLLATAAFAADPAGFTLWTASDLKAKAQTLSGKVNAQKVAVETLATYGNHLAMIAHREGPGETEVHEKMADVFVVQDGEATLVVGGTVAGGRTTDPGEMRGGTISGGEKHKLVAGDIAHIPANVPHQMLVDAGKQVTYFVIKVSKP